MQVNGVRVLAIVAVPLLISLVVFGVLWMRGVDRGPGAVAWTMIGALSALTPAGMLTIGPFILPTTACLAVACGIRQGRSTPPLGQR